MFEADGLSIFSNQNVSQDFVDASYVIATERLKKQSLQIHFRAAGQIQENRPVVSEPLV